MSPPIVDGRSAAIRTHGGDGLIACSGWYGLQALQQDYSSVDFDGVTYWVRS